MAILSLPTDLDAVASYKGIGVVLEHPDQDGGPENPPSAAYHWWKAFGVAGDEFYVVAPARLEDVHNSTQDGPGSPIDSVRYFIDARLRTGATANTATPILEWNPSTKTMKLWSLDDTARLELDEAIRARALYGAKGVVDLDDTEKMSIRDGVIAAWSDPAEREALTKQRDTGSGASEALMAASTTGYEHAAAATLDAKHRDMVLPGGDKVKAARGRVVAATDISLTDVGQMLSRNPIHIRGATSVGQYL